MGEHGDKQNDDDKMVCQEQLIHRSVIIFKALGRLN